VHIDLESVGEGLLLARGDLDAILLGGQVANDARAGWVEVGSPQGAANELHSDRVGLFVGEGQNGFGGDVVDQFDAEDFGGGEGGCDGDVERGSLIGVLDLLVGDLGN
jgi:hypothetical protein